MLRLKPKPEAWSGASRWVFLCERRPACKGLLSTHPDGSPLGAAVPQAIRTARSHCHAVFDRLWLDAADMYRLRETGSAQKKAIALIRRTARVRAYEFVADKLGMTEADCHIGKITDLETLRKFWRAAKDATPEEIRAWAKARRNA